MLKVKEKSLTGIQKVYRKFNVQKKKKKKEIVEKDLLFSLGFILPQVSLRPHTVSCFNQTLFPPEKTHCTKKREKKQKKQSEEID